MQDVIFGRQQDSIRHGPSRRSGLTFSAVGAIVTFWKAYAVQLSRELNISRCRRGQARLSSGTILALRVPRSVAKLPTSDRRATLARLLGDRVRTRALNKERCLSERRTKGTPVTRTRPADEHELG